VTQLGPTSRALIAAARLGDPDAATAARVRAKIAATLAGGAIVTSTAATSSATSASAATAASAGSVAAIPSGSTVASSLALKLGLVVIAIGAVVTTAVVVERTRSSSVSAPAIAASTTSDDEPHGTVHVATPETRPNAGRPTVVPSRPAVSVPRNSGPSLAREVELIDRASRSSDYTTALQTIDVYERETAGHGQLGEEAAAIAIEAHCHLHDSVTEMLEVFDRTWPRSAQRARLTAACGH
jgi:hypothetical protein